MIPRKIESEIIKTLVSKKIVILYGARQTGKTTLSNKLINELDFNENEITRINSDDRSFDKFFEVVSLGSLEKIINNTKLVFIDEAQKLPNIGENMKLLYDSPNRPMILLTGSSSFELAAKTKESLAGRALTYKLNALSLEEISHSFGEKKVIDGLEDNILYGQYPEIYSQKDPRQKQKLLEQLVDSTLLKDLLNLETITKPQKLLEILKILAYQMGSNVSILDISSRLEISRETVLNYISYLEQSFIIFRLKGISANMRSQTIKETRQMKIYFYDLGIRNMLIQNFDDLAYRQDSGALFENFIILERLKTNANNPMYNQYFYRDKEQKEIDLVETLGSKVFLIEVKHSSKKKYKFPKSVYSMLANDKMIRREVSEEIITKENYLDYLLK